MESRFLPKVAINRGNKLPGLKQVSELFKPHNFHIQVTFSYWNISIFANKPRSMSVQDKGIYPIWVSEKDIINQILKEIAKAGGRLPYSYVVNSEHSPEIQQRMKSILERMHQEKLITITKDSTFLEITIEGNKANELGYTDYQKALKWDGLRYIFNRVLLVLFCLVVLGIIAILIYFGWHIFK
jgi:hypothetical protein